MAINRSTRYPNRFADPVAGQPEGAFINKTGELAVDGSYLEKDWANDWAAFFSSLLSGDAANGTPDEVGASQLFNGLINLIVPVGRVVYTVADINPVADYPGTTWQRIAEGRYIAAEGSFVDSAGTPGTLPAGNFEVGTYLHTLTVDEMPAHKHDLTQWGNIGATGSEIDVHSRTDRGGTTPTLENTGGGIAHNNMPPAFVLYTWERTA